MRGGRAKREEDRTSGWVEVRLPAVVRQNRHRMCFWADKSPTQPQRTIHYAKKQNYVTISEKRYCNHGTARVVERVEVPDTPCFHAYFKPPRMRSSRGLTSFPVAVRLVSTRSREDSIRQTSPHKASPGLAMAATLLEGCSGNDPVAVCNPFCGPPRLKDALSSAIGRIS